MCKSSRQDLLIGPTRCHKENFKMMTRIKVWMVKVLKVYKSIALDISTLLFMASVLMTYLVSQDFILSRVCTVNLGYTKEVCEAIVDNKGNHTLEETQIQKVMTDIRIMRSFLDYSIPIVFVIFQGSWSDIHGRKLALLLPCFGFTVQALTFFACKFFEGWDAYTVVLISTIPKCLSGSDVTFRMAALSYISDISTKHGRTLRTGLISAALGLGVPVGFALGGAAVKSSLGTDVPFLISACISATSFVTILLLVDNRPKIPNDEKNIDTENQASVSKERRCLTLSNIKSVLRSLVLSFDGVSTAVRLQLVILIVAIICVLAPIQGEFGVMYLYLRKKLMWNLADYGLFSAYVSLIGAVGTLLSMGFLCSILQLSDPIIGFIAGISQFGGCFMYAFASNNWMVYSAPTIDMMNGTMAVVARSMLSKLCPPKDIGKLFSFLAVTELLVPLVFDPAYSTIYFHTMDTFPGTVFLLSAALTVPPQLTYVFYIFWQRRNIDSCIITPTKITSHKGSGEKYEATSDKYTITKEQ